MNNKKRIVIAPLDWGLGHASRCVPIIRALLDFGHEVIIVADKNPLAFLRMEFPDLRSIRLPAFQITYPGKREHGAENGTSNSCLVKANLQRAR